MSLLTLSGCCVCVCEWMDVHLHVSRMLDLSKCMKQLRVACLNPDTNLNPNPAITLIDRKPAFDVTKESRESNIPFEFKLHQEQTDRQVGGVWGPCDYDWPTSHRTRWTTTIRQPRLRGCNSKLAVVIAVYSIKNDIYTTITLTCPCPRPRP